MSKEIEIRISGDTSSGKSTVLVLIAQYLNSLGYTIGIPQHLVGLSVNVELLREDHCQSTLVKLREFIESKDEQGDLNESYECDT